MATKKQKRERGEARYRERLQASIDEGIKFLEQDRKFRHEKLRDAHRPKHEKQHSRNKPVKDCVICQDDFIAERKQQRELEGPKRG